MANVLDKKKPTAAATHEAGSRSDYLLDIAAQIFLEQGFEGTSVGAIARRAGASKETFYSKYTNKGELFRTAMGRLMDRFASRVTSTLQSDGPPDEVLTSFGNIFLERMLSDEGIGMQKIVYMEAGRFPEVAKVFFELGPRRTTNALVGYFQAQIKKGNIRKMDVELASAHFIGLLASDLMMRKSLGILNQPSPTDKAYRIKSAVAVFMRAYGPL